MCREKLDINTVGNELGYFSGSSEVYESDEGHDLDSSYFGTLGLSYKF